MQGQCKREVSINFIPYQLERSLILGPVATGSFCVAPGFRHCRVPVGRGGLHLASETAEVPLLLTSIPLAVWRLGFGAEVQPGTEPGTESFFLILSHLQKRWAHAVVFDDQPVQLPDRFMSPSLHCIGRLQGLEALAHLLVELDPHRCTSCPEDNRPEET